MIGVEILDSSTTSASTPLRGLTNRIYSAVHQSNT